MDAHEPVNILMVDDQPDKLLSYEIILRELGENLIMAGSGREALEYLLHTDVALILLDVSMPEIDGFELAALIRQHPRYQQTAIIFISAIHQTYLDQLKGYAPPPLCSLQGVPDLFWRQGRVYMADADVRQRVHHRIGDSHWGRQRG